MCIYLSGKSLHDPGVRTLGVLDRTKSTHHQPYGFLQSLQKHRTYHGTSDTVAIAMPSRVSEDAPMSGTVALVWAAALSFAAGLLHIGVILGGPSWYRFFGAGERMATLAERGSVEPTLVTLGIAAMLFVWGLYALSGAGVIFKLPLLKLGLSLITFVYLARGVAGFILPFVSSHPFIAQNSVLFWFVSSFVCCIFGAFYLLGTINSWAQLAND